MRKRFITAAGAILTTAAFGTQATAADCRTGPNRRVLEYCAYLTTSEHSGSTNSVDDFLPIHQETIKNNVGLSVKARNEGLHRCEAEISTAVARSSTKSGPAPYYTAVGDMRIKTPAGLDSTDIKYTQFSKYASPSVESMQEARARIKKAAKIFNQCFRQHERK